VPTSVRVVAVPDVLIRIHPEWRGHRYFVVHDDIVIVDTSHRIVSVVAVGSSGAQNDNSDRGSVAVRSGGAMNLSVEEIREVQVVLVREGFDVEIDGRLSPKFNEALISFQRKHGLQATGQIDSQTVTKLGVNIRSGGATTGQGGQQGNQGNMPSREGQQGQQNQQGGDRNNQRSDQDRRDGNAPSNTEGRSNQDRNNAPSTTGQGGQQGGERGNMPKGQQDGGQKGMPSNRDQQK
jgi:peptidoglycan hydrolase-like protein with peptidoglycan-binding domain